MEEDSEIDGPGMRERLLAAHSGHPVQRAEAQRAEASGGIRTNPPSALTSVRGRFLKVRLGGREVVLSAPRLAGVALVVVGAVLLVMMLGAQSRIDEIGETTDDALLVELDDLRDARGAYMVSGIGLIFLGLFGVAILSERSAPVKLSESQMLGSARMAHDFLAGLSLAGDASYLPAKNGLTRERAFLPAPREGGVPPAATSDDLTVSPGKDGSTPGMLVEPLGLDLLYSIQYESGTDLAGVGLEAAEGALQVLKHDHGIIRDFHFKERDGRTVLRVEYKELLGACRTVRRDMPDTCRQMACIGCSCILAAAARATGKRVEVERVDGSQDTVVFTLRLWDW